MIDRGSASNTAIVTDAIVSNSNIMVSNAIPVKVNSSTTQKCHNIDVRGGSMCGQRREWKNVTMLAMVLIEGELALLLIEKDIW